MSSIVEKNVSEELRDALRPERNRAEKAFSERFSGPVIRLTQLRTKPLATVIFGLNLRDALRLKFDPDAVSGGSSSRQP